MPKHFGMTCDMTPSVLSSMDATTVTDGLDELLPHRKLHKSRIVKRARKRSRSDTEVSPRKVRKHSEKANMSDTEEHLSETDSEFEKTIAFMHKQMEQAQEVCLALSPTPQIDHAFQTMIELMGRLCMARSIGMRMTHHRPTSSHV